MAGADFSGLTQDTGGGWAPGNAGGGTQRVPGADYPGPPPEGYAGVKAGVNEEGERAIFALQEGSQRVAGADYPNPPPEGWACVWVANAMHRAAELLGATQWPPSGIPTPGQRGYSPQRHTAAGTAVPATADTGNIVPQRNDPTQTATPADAPTPFKWSMHTTPRLCVLSPDGLTRNPDTGGSTELLGATHGPPSGATTHRTPDTGGGAELLGATHDPPSGITTRSNPNTGGGIALLGATHRPPSGITTRGGNTALLGAANCPPSGIPTGGGTELLDATHWPPSNITTHPNSARPAYPRLCVLSPDPVSTRATLPVPTSADKTAVAGHLLRAWNRTNYLRAAGLGL